MTATPAKAPASLTREDKRRHKRYQVDWVTQVQYDGEWYEVTISDVSASGALILAPAPPPAGDELKVVLPNYGEIDARIAHSASDFCGIEFLDPATHRDRLTRWLMEEVSEAGADAATAARSQQ